MTNCKGCPFLVWNTDHESGGDYNCSLHNTVKETIDSGRVSSSDCKLDIVQLSIKGELNSNTFIPKDIDGA